MTAVIKMLRESMAHIAQLFFGGGPLVESNTPIMKSEDAVRRPGHL